MKKTLLLAALAISTLTFTGCNKMANEFKHMESDWVGLNRTITLYDGNSTNVLGRWTTTSKIEHNGSGIQFLDARNKVVAIAGTYIVQEN
jgi:hypothetical protein